MKEYIEKYLDGIRKQTEVMDQDTFIRIIEVLKTAREDGKQIFLMGNGGSAATANHFVCDFGKNAVKGDEGRFKIVSLCDSISYITAYGNDMGFENIFLEPLKNLVEYGDIVLAISVSGNSPDIIKAVEFAKSKGCIVIGLTGFKGGKLKEMSDININADMEAIEAVEDVHSIILHMIVYCFKQLQKT